MSLEGEIVDVGLRDGLQAEKVILDPLVEPEVFRAALSRAMRQPINLTATDPRRRGPGR